MATTVSTSRREIVRKPTFSGSISAVETVVVRGSGPKISIARFCRKKLTANDVTSSVASSALRTGRNAIRSIPSANTATITIASTSSTGHGGPAASTRK